MLQTSDRSFEDFYLSQDMRRALEAISYTRPTAVQEASIPLILAGIDLIVQSQTGSGKTAAFAIPTIEMLEPHPGRIEVLVLVPTRELAKQVCDEFERLGQFKQFSATAIYGGASYEVQYKALETAQIVCATPGRLIDLLKRGRLDLNHVRILCLDEADEMLSMGFKEDIEAIMAYLPQERQSLMFSATVNETIKSLAQHILFYPEYITLSSKSVANVDVTHQYYNVRGVSRGRDMLKILELEEPESAIIFANTKDDTFTLTGFLKRHGYRVDVLNGDLPQAEREKTLAALRSGRIDLIVATDVAARGIDISELSHVINYALPESAEVYIHRTGRTGRAGKKGKAISLVAPNEVATFFQIRKTYGVKLEQREMPTTEELVAARQRRALERLSQRLETEGPVAYGGKLAMASQLLGPEVGEDRLRMMAQLLTLAEGALEGRTPVVEPARPSEVIEVAKAVEAPEPAVETAAPAQAAAPAPTFGSRRETAMEAPEALTEAVTAPVPAAPVAIEEPTRRRAPAVAAPAVAAPVEVAPVEVAPEPVQTEASEGFEAHEEVEEAVGTAPSANASDFGGFDDRGGRRRARGRGRRRSGEHRSAPGGSIDGRPAPAPVSLVSAIAPPAREEAPVAAAPAAVPAPVTRQAPAAPSAAPAPRHAATEAVGEAPRPKRVRSNRPGDTAAPLQAAPAAAPAAPAPAAPAPAAAPPVAARPPVVVEAPAPRPASSTNGQSSLAPSVAVGSDQRKMYINLGREHFDNSGELADTLAWLSGMDVEDIVSVTMESTFSYVLIRRDYFADFVGALNQQEWNGVVLQAEAARK